MGQVGRDDPADDFGEPVKSFVTRVQSLTDDELRSVADARAAVDEEFHLAALAAAAEALARGRSEEYARARLALSRAHVADRLDELTGDERAEWEAVARLAQLAIDDGLLAHLTGDVIHPKHVRELYRSLRILDA